MASKSIELKHTIHLIEVFSSEINEIESAINIIMDSSNSLIATISSLKNRIDAMILAKVGDFSRLLSAEQLLAYAGLSPSAYHPRKLTSNYSNMEKRGAIYLRYALFNAVKYTCLWKLTFKAYLMKNVLKESITMLQYPTPAKTRSSDLSEKAI